MLENLTEFCPQGQDGRFPLMGVLEQCGKPVVFGSPMAVDSQTPGLLRPYRSPCFSRTLQAGHQ